MAGELFGLRLARQTSAGCIRVCGLGAITGVVAAYLFVLCAFAQDSPSRVPRLTKPSPAATHHKKREPDPPLIAEPSPQPAPLPTPPPTLTPEQMPPRTPEVVWDGKMLSIDAENSTLSDILVAVRARTGAAIDLPAGASTERLAARLGPAPVREVLTSLLSGTDYDYIIQASETNDDEIQSVILTPRGKDDALANTSVVASNPRIRRPPGYTASGKHTFEVIPETTHDNAVPDDVASAGDQTAQDPSTPGSETANAAPPSAAESPSGSDSTSTPTASLASSDSHLATQGTPSGMGGVRADPAGTFEERVQNMQQMFEQRRQIQMQQNQAQQNQAPSPRN